MTEKQLSDAVSQAARLLGWVGYHTFDSRRSSEGFPDWVFIRRSRLLAVELKTERGKLRPGQQMWLDAFEGAGQESYLWRPADWASGRIETILR